MNLSFFAKNVTWPWPTFSFRSSSFRIVSTVTVIVHHRSYQFKLFFKNKKLYSQNDFENKKLNKTIKKTKIYKNGHGDVRSRSRLFTVVCRCRQAIRAANKYLTHCPSPNLLYESQRSTRIKLSFACLPQWPNWPAMICIVNLEMI